MSTSASARQTLGVYKSWAAFRDDRPGRCYAIAAPAGSGASPRSFVSVANWPARQTYDQLHLRLSRPARDGSAVLLTIDGQVFQLSGRGTDAWAPARPVDRAIVTAMRGGVAMTVSTRDRQGNRYIDSFALSGAATAIDAAALACRRG